MDGASELVFNNCILDKFPFPDAYDDIFFEMDLLGQTYRVKIFHQLYEALGRPEKILVSNMNDAVVGIDNQQKNLDKGLWSIPSWHRRETDWGGLSGRGENNTD